MLPQQAHGGEFTNFIVLARRVYYLVCFWTAGPILGLQVWSPLCVCCQHMASCHSEDTYSISLLIIDHRIYIYFFMGAGVW